MEPTEETACDCAACRSGLRKQLAGNIQTLRRSVAILDAVELSDPMVPEEWQIAHALVIEAAEETSATATLIRFFATPSA